ncbi:PadR family transcriptional regulator [Halobellus rubicundus]|uniref:PadR family transcriptional regulator n=1 Tax=Halobellus rubicundus TaxID=2996466 RepID=A0ABD5MIT4_9EURY
MSESNEQGYNANPTDDDASTASEPHRIEYFDLTAFQRDILAAIAAHEGVPYGLAIKRRIEAWYVAEINHGRLYPNLDELVEQGLIRKSEIDKRTNGYELTERGADVLTAGADLLDEVRPQPRHATERPTKDEPVAPAQFGGGV